MLPFLESLLKDPHKGKKLTYVEFWEVMQQHYLHRHAQIEQQLTDWTNDDQSIAPLANKVRQTLQAVVAKFPPEKSTSESKA